MSGLLESLGLDGVLTPERTLALARAAIVLVVGVIAARLVTTVAVRIGSARLSPQGAVLLRRLVFYPLLLLVLASTLHQLGFNLSVILGAAGILTVALGFASQTSASNLISGLFLVAERPFVVGDVIAVGDLAGEVLSIDLLSVKVRTFDNLYVRIPNETLIKSNITNRTHFPVRRLDLAVTLPYGEDPARVKRLLVSLARDNPVCLADPKPLFLFLRFGNDGVEYQFSVWAVQEAFLELRNSLPAEILTAFGREGIEIPYPQRTLHAGRGAGALPVRVLEREREGT